MIWATKSYSFLFLGNVEAMWLKCPTCSKKFSSFNQYLLHCDEHRSLSSKQRFPCPLCPATLGNKTEFWRHLPGHKKDKPVEKRESRVCHCTHCGHLFNSLEEFEVAVLYAMVIYHVNDDYIYCLIVRKLKCNHKNSYDL